MNNKKPPIESALEVMQQHISALNAGDSKQFCTSCRNHGRSVARQLPLTMDDWAPNNDPKNPQPIASFGVSSKKSIRSIGPKIITRLSLSARDRIMSSVTSPMASMVFLLRFYFPHFRLSGNAMSIWINPEHYLRDFHARAGEDWCYSAFSDIQVLQASENKVHLDVEILRYRADNTLITRFRSLWVIVEINEVWAAKFRSSFASK